MSTATHIEPKDQHPQSHVRNDNKRRKETVNAMIMAKTTRIPMRLPVPSILTPGRRLYFGFDVTKDFLPDYAKKYWMDFHTFGYENANEQALSLSGMTMLRWKTGVRNLSFAMGIPDSTSAAHGTETTGYGEEKDMVPLLAVCSSRLGSYEHRPTQEEFVRLEAAVGRPAQWWIDYESDYHPYSSLKTSPAPEARATLNSSVEIHVPDAITALAIPPPREPMHLPVPSMLTPGRRLYFGFDVTDEFLKDYARKYWMDFHKFTCENADGDTLLLTAMTMLRFKTGVRNLSIAMGMPDSTSAAHGTNTPWHGTENDMVPLLAVCSSRLESYQRRPTREAFMRLEAAVGWPAQWWIDYESDY
ncbi:hypothetical protein Hypma_000261 [Hypsizygus marmoreus]|uniref:Uncharacterized protein n=1 Tax=Hypsizygus marmoreus TaxID=39966 RepID=A0A369J8V2_HYPMA|nr:hypothetical protein Hypma_000261 [Hypsizygus marmoreus]